LVNDAGGEHVRVFGSVARGDDDEGSDIDLLFVMRRPLSLMELGRLEDEVSAVVGVPVDLLPESSLRPDAAKAGLDRGRGTVRRRLPKQTLQEALAQFEVVADYGAGDLSDQKTIDAICMRLPAGIEALFGDVWNQMWGCGTGSRTATCWSSRRLCAALSTATCR
jgi:predicted nucleotidyltransferase